MIGVNDQMFFPLPLRELSESMRKKRPDMCPLVDALIEDYVKVNGTGFLRVNDLLMKKLEESFDLYSFTKSDEEELEFELKKIDFRFKPVLDIMRELSWDEKKRLFVDNFNNLSLNLRKVRDSLHDEFLERKQLYSKDYAINSYFLYFIAMLDLFSDALEESNKDGFTKKLAITNMAAVTYGTVITSYFQGNLKEEILRERLGELASYTDPLYRKQSRKVKKALELISDAVPPS